MNTRTHLHRLALPAILTLALLPVSLRAASVTWTGGPSGIWSDATSWSTGGVPGAADDVRIDANAAQASHVSIGAGNASIQKLTVDAGDQLTLPDNRILVLRGSTQTINGTLALAPTSIFTELYFSRNALMQVGGTGRISLSGPLARVFFDGSTTVDHTATFAGAGQLNGSNGGSVFNNLSGGTVVADLNAQTLALSPGVGSMWSNAGLYAARSGGILTLFGTYANTGSIRAETGSTVHLSGAAITGGIIESQGTGLVQNSANSSIRNLRLTGRLLVNNSTILSMGGTIQNEGAIDLNSTTTFTDVTFAPGTTLTGGGTLRMGAGPGTQSRLFAQTAGAMLTHQSHTISGSGTLESATIRNEAGGRIIADQPARALVLDPGTDPWINLGAYEAVNSATLSLQSGTYDCTGGGTITAGAGATVRCAGGSILIGARLLAGGSDAAAVKYELQDTRWENVTLEAPAAARLASTKSLTLAGTFTNSSTLTLDGTFADLLIPAPVTLQGGGVIQCTGPQCRVYGAGSLTNTDVRIHGSGQLGMSQCALTLEANATLEANVSSAPLQVRSAAPGLSSAGTLRASGGGLLDIGGTPVTLASPTVVEVVNGGEVRFGTSVSGPISAGTLGFGTWKAKVGPAGQPALISMTGTAQINAAHVTLDGAAASFPAIAPLHTNSGTLELLNGKVMALAGGLTQSGSLVVTDGARLSAAGAITFAAASQTRASVTVAGPAPLTSTAAVTLGGVFRIVPPAGFVALAATELPLITAASVTGDATSVVYYGPMPNGMRPYLKKTATTVSVAFTTGVAEGYFGWIQQYPSLSAADAAPGADADADGMDNLLEYAHGTSPLANNVSSVQFIMVTSGATSHAGITLARATGSARPDLVWSAQRYMPSGWSSEHMTGPVTAPISATKEQATWRVALPLTARELMRVRVSFF